MDLRELVGASRLEESSTVVDCQEKLLNITIETVNDVFEYIVKSPCMNCDGGMNRILDYVYLSLRLRYGKMRPMALLLKKLVNLDDPVFLPLKSLLLAPLTKSNSVERFRLSLLYHCLVAGVVTPKEIMPLIEQSVSFMQAWVNSMIFFWFAPWIEKENPKLFAELIEEMDAYCDSDFCDCFTNLESLKQNDWALLRQILDVGYAPETAEVVIMADDVASLQKISAKAGFQWDQCIKQSGFEHCEYLRRKVTYIEFAAFVGATKCFNFLLLNSDNYPPTTVNYAIAGGNIEIVRLCDKKGLGFTHTHLEIATTFHHFDILRWLFLSKTPPIDISASITDLFGVAAKADNVRVLLFCLEKGVAINETSGKDKVGALHWAAGINEIDALQLLLSVNGVDPNIQDGMGNTPILIAVRNGNIRATNLLLKQKNISVNIVGGPEKTGPIHEAARNSNPEFIKALLAHHDIDIQLLDKKVSFIIYNETALHHAVLANNIEVVKMLAQNPQLDINAKDMFGYTALHYAAHYGHVDVAKFLITLKGVRVNEKENMGVYFSFIKHHLTSHVATTTRTTTKK